MRRAYLTFQPTDVRKCLQRRLVYFHYANHGVSIVRKNAHDTVQLKEGKI